jgi:TolB-like protein
MRTDLQRLKRDAYRDSHPTVSMASVPAAPVESKDTQVTKKRGMWIAAASIVLVLLVAAVFYLGRRTNAPSTPTTATGKTAIAVLPFANMSADKDQEYFSDGLTEELLNVLAKNPKLQVTSRTSAFAFKGKEVDLKTIAEKLGVTHVLEGSVRKSGIQLRITAQLAEVATDSHLWSQTYQRQMEDIFTLQDDIATSVASALKATLEAGQAPKTQQADPEAYNAYLQGRYFFERRSKEDLEKAVFYLEQALQIDPGWLAPGRFWRGFATFRPAVAISLWVKAMRRVRRT